MRILFIVPYAPNLVRVRPYNLIKALAALGHAVTLATLWESEEEREGLGALEAAGVRIVAEHHTKARALANCLRALPGRDPLQAHYCWNPKLNAQCTRLNAQGVLDVVHVEHLRGARYGLSILHGPSSVARPPVVWDSVDCISHLFEQAAKRSRSFFGRWVTRFELGRTRRYEGRLVHEFDRVLVTSPVDREALERLGREYPPPGSAAPSLRSRASAAGGRIAVLPNGVDLGYFCPTAEPREPATLVFTGKMSYHANVTAALELVEKIMPRIWAARPDVTLQIVGKDPSRGIRSAVLGEARINLAGTVPDMRPYLARSTLALAPVPYAAGSQLKVLEAMACGTPVVSSPQAVSALSVDRQQDVVVADGSGAFADAVLELLADAALRQSIGQAGRRYVERYHDWSTIAARLSHIYEDAAAG